jgi:hypothetical protein
MPVLPLIVSANDDEFGETNDARRVDDDVPCAVAPIVNVTLPLVPFCGPATPGVRVACGAADGVATSAELVLPRLHPNRPQERRLQESRPRQRD